MRKLNLKIIILLTVLLVTLAISANGAFSWFNIKTEDVVEGETGKVVAAVEGGGTTLRAANSFGGGSATSSVKKDFSIKNNSNIDSFVRITFTPVYGRAGGSEVLVDSSKMAVESVSLNVNGKSGITGKVVSGTTASGYKKDFVYPMGSSGYYRLAPGENITGSITLSGIVTETETPDIVIGTESIQATKSALEDAQAFGWSASNFN